MDNKLNKVLSDLYTDKITITEACDKLNKTRDEVWELLDSFEYFPTNEDVLLACEIEQKSMKDIEHAVSIENKLHSKPRICSPHTKQTLHIPIKNISDPISLPDSIPYKPEIPNNIVWYAKNEFKPMFEVGCGA